MFNKDLQIDLDLKNMLNFLFGFDVVDIDTRMEIDTVKIILQFKKKHWRAHARET